MGEGTSSGQGGPYRTPGAEALARTPPPFVAALYQPRSKGTHTAVMLGAVAFGAALGATTFGVGVLPLLGYVLWSRRNATRLLVRVEEATQRLSSGEIEGPVKVYDEAARRARGRPPFHAGIALNRAIALIRTGEFSRAVELLESLRDCGWLDRGPLAGHVEMALASCEALRGRVESARRWRESARAKVPPSRTGLLVFADVALAAREERFLEAVSLVDRKSAEAEPLTGPSGMRAMRVLQAFARASDSAPPPAERLESALEAVRPLRPRELDYLAAEWPALRRFMQEHRLLGPPDPGSSREV